MACGHKNLIVLVPDPDGSVGQVTVSNAAGSVDMNRANQSTSVRDRTSAPAAPAELKPAQVQDLFGKVLSNVPLPPIHFLLYFESDSVQLLPASVELLPEIVSAIQQRAPTRISVVGHSDTRGDKAYNLDLSRRRAAAVKQRLVDSGVDDTFMDVSSHGEENPLVKTADNVANAKNRRVEVVVR
jgi:outer membrane protein OmpA-like peptidoglycan-associated protein